MVDRFQKIRREYQGATFDESNLKKDPMQQLEAWLDDAINEGIPNANAMSVSTVSKDNKPSTRMVLLKQTDAEKLTFFTNYNSRKSQEISHCPNVALLFWWEPLARQIRIEGTIKKADEAVSDDYFASRPRDSNLSAMSSAQSQVVPNREFLEARVDDIQTEWDGRELVRPANWGGYCVSPTYFEFWQGRENRLHDRIVFALQDGDWTVSRLAP